MDQSICLLSKKKKHWRPEALLRVEISSHGCPEKEFKSKELPTIPKAKKQCSHQSGHEAPSNCNSVLQRTKTSSNTDYIRRFVSQILTNK
jgi:hypothetical protein